MSLSASPRHVVAVTALGTQVHVEVAGGNAGSVAADLLRAWSRCDARRVDEANGRSVRVLVDDDPAVIEDAATHGAIAGASGSVVGDQVALAVTLQAIEANEGDLLMLRAAAVADPETGYQVYVDGKEMVIGGTSAVSPLWAGIVARLAQQAGKPLGPLQPRLYAEVSAGVASPVLRDITQGDNGAYAAGPGWDACTGLGVPSQELASLAGAPS